MWNPAKGVSEKREGRGGGEFKIVNVKSCCTYIEIEISWCRLSMVLRLFSNLDPREGRTSGEKRGLKLGEKK